MKQYGEMSGHRGLLTLFAVLALTLGTTACNDSTTSDNTDDGTTADDGGSTDNDTTTISGVTGDYNFLILGLELEAGEDATSTGPFPREARVGPSGDRLEGSLTATTNGYQFAFTAGDEASSTFNWSNEGSGWQLGNTNFGMPPIEHEVTAPADYDQPETSETFSISDAGLMELAGGLDGVVAGDGGAFAFNSGYSAENDTDSPDWHNRTEYQNLVLGSKAWTPSSSIQADFNMLGLAFVLDNDTTDSNGDGGNVVGVGARVLTSGRAILDGSGQTLDMWWHRKRATLGLDDAAATEWEDDRGTQSSPRSKSIDISDRGWIHVVDNGTPDARPFAMLAPNGEMFVTQTRKLTTVDNSNERVRYRMRIGLPRGGAQNEPTCTANTFNGDYRMTVLAMEMDPATATTPFTVANETGPNTYTVTNGSLAATDEAFYRGILEVTSSNSTVTKDEGSEQGDALTTTMNSDCTFTVEDANGDSIPGEAINGIISPDGERVVITIYNGSWNGMMVGFRTAE